MVVGPTGRDLIAQGSLCPYRILAPPSDLHLDTVPITATGEYSKAKLKVEVRRSKLVGQIVPHYLKHAKGKLGITFCSDLDSALETTEAYVAAGVPAALVSAKTPLGLRQELLREHKARRLLQLVNVDLFGEGFDVPAIEVVSMARPTASFNLFCQQFGRALRVMKGKKEALVIDHVDNCVFHARARGLPDQYNNWSLNRVDKRSLKIDNACAIRICVKCFGAYERFRKSCPYCSTKIPEPTARTGPEFVDGDLEELDVGTLRTLQQKVVAVDGAPPLCASKNIVSLSIAKNHRLRQESQKELRDTMSQWAGYKRPKGFTLSEIQKKFYLRFGIDVLTAQTLGRKDAQELKGRIDDHIKEMSYV
jgi:hypothetical protein